MKVDAYIARIIVGAALIFRGAGWKRIAVLPQRVCLEKRGIADAVVRAILTLSDTTVAASSKAARLSHSGAIGSLDNTCLKNSLRLQHVIRGTTSAAVLTGARAQLNALIGKTSTIYAAGIAEAAETAVGGIQAVVTVG